MVARAQKGDDVALAHLLQQHYLPVKKYLMTVTFDAALAEDLTQEAMIRAIQRIGQYAGRSKFSTWLISVATNLYMDYLRRRKREQELYAESVPVPAHDTPDPAWTDIVDRLKAMPRDVALPIVLKHYHGYSYEEIAEWMGIPAGTVKSRIFNGIRTLRRREETDEG